MARNVAFLREGLQAATWRPCRRSGGDPDTSETSSHAPVPLSPHRQHRRPHPRRDRDAGRRPRPGAGPAARGVAELPRPDGRHQPLRPRRAAAGPGAAVGRRRRGRGGRPGRHPGQGRRPRRRHLHAELDRRRDRRRRSGQRAGRRGPWRAGRIPCVRPGRAGASARPSVLRGGCRPALRRRDRLERALWRPASAAAGRDRAGAGHRRRLDPGAAIRPRRRGPGDRHLLQRRQAGAGARRWARPSWSTTAAIRTGRRRCCG